MSDAPGVAVTQRENTVQRRLTLRVRRARTLFAGGFGGRVAGLWFFCDAADAMGIVDILGRACDLSRDFSAGFYWLYAISQFANVVSKERLYRDAE